MRQKNKYIPPGKPNNLYPKDKMKHTWTDVTDMDAAVSKSLVDIMYALKDYSSVFNAGTITATADIIGVLTGVMSDLNAYAGDIQTIRTKYAGFSGDIKDETEFVLSLAVFQDYVALNELFQNNIFMPMIVLSEYMTEEMHKLKQTTSAPEHITVEQLLLDSPDSLVTDVSDTMSVTGVTDE